MATIDLALLLGANMHATVTNERLPFHYAEYILNLATAITTKGSALASADVIQVLDIPAESVIMAAGMETLTAVTGGTVLTGSLGVTAAPAVPANFITVYDMFAAVAGDYAPMNAAAYPLVTKSANTLDLLLPTVTGAVATGRFRIWVMYGDVRDYITPAIAALGS